MLKLVNIIAPMHDILFGVRAAFFPTFLAILLSPSMLIRWRTLSEVFMANLWADFGDEMDQNSSDEKIKLLMTPENVPEGVVLDIGAGHGHSIKYLDRSRVKRYIALEPNVLMHQSIRTKAGEHGYFESDGSLIILPCGAEDSSYVLSSLVSAGVTDPQPIDSIVSIMTLCSVPNPRATLHHLVRDVLKSGGVLFMYEHVLNPREDVQWWQRFWAPIWAVVFCGCRLDRDTDIILKSLEIEGGSCNENAWREWKTWGKEGESEECLFWHCGGRFVKK